MSLFSETVGGACEGRIQGEYRVLDSVQDVIHHSKFLCFYHLPFLEFNLLFPLLFYSAAFVKKSNNKYTVPFCNMYFHSNSPVASSSLPRRRTDPTTATFTPSSASSLPSETPSTSHVPFIGPKLPPVASVQGPGLSQRGFVPEVAFCSDLSELTRSAEILYVSGLGPLVEIIPASPPVDLGYIMTRLGAALRRILVVSPSWMIPNGGPIQVDRAVALLQSDTELSDFVMEGSASVKPYHPCIDEEHTIEICKSFQAKDGSSGCCALIAYRDAVRVLRDEKKNRVLMIKRAGRLGMDNSVTIKYFIEAVLGDSGCVKHVLMLPCKVASCQSRLSNSSDLSLTMAPEMGFLVFTDDFSPLRALGLTVNGELIVKPGVSLRLEMYSGCDFARRDTVG
ncbi:hypothetical protein FOL46_005308 [Perkinsus olseni]|uniref:Uncharacterized protein n=1 Tax=Perkinsus olseni TaxID=32597 RepID=A0A7J6MS38_PEROL|nr:hypothetical protein FOL46_005308 [Perkinsus olseni]